MNCEKCKNKKATVFFADEGGGRHALCASCGAIQGKLGQITQGEKIGGEISVFLPEPTLLSLSNSPLTLEPSFAINDSSLVCPVCKTTAGDLAKGGLLGCASCYTVFSDALPTLSDDQTNEALGRMPRYHRSRRDRQIAITQFKSQIKQAVEEENYELAATLRDKIRKLEASVV